MPFYPLQIQPGVNVEETRTLNQGGWQTSNLVRFFNGIPQKLGGWIQYTTANVLGIVRYLHPWQVLSGIRYLAVSTNTDVVLIENNIATTISPIVHRTSGVVVGISLTVNTRAATVTDPTYSPSDAQYVNFLVPVYFPAANVVLNGVYQAGPVSGSTYDVFLPEITTVSTSVYQLPNFSTTAGSTTVTVSGYPHGYSVGNVFTNYVNVVVGGIDVVADNYFVTSVPSATSFTIAVPSPAITTQTVAQAPNPVINYIEFTDLEPAFGPNGPPNSPVGLQFPTWITDNWGQILIACAPFGPIFDWDPNAGGNLALIANAPSVNTGIFVAMPEQILVAYGSTENTDDGPEWDPLFIRWSDVSDFTDWTPTTTNQAGSFRLPSGSAIIRGLQAPQQALFWTDIELWSMQYIGFPLVFGFNKIGQNCGLIGPYAVAIMNTGVFWMSQNQFFMLNANGVSVMACTVWDEVFQNLNTALVGKIVAMPNSYFNEIGWCYPSLDSTSENDSYVKVNLSTGVWDYGKLARTSWIDQSILGSPIGTDVFATIFQHEIGYDQVSTHLDPANPVQPLTPSIETGYIMIADGNYMTYVDQIYPDIRFGMSPDSDPTGTIMMTVDMIDFPGDEPRRYGPFPVDSQTQYITLAARGRQMSLKFSSDDIGSFWRIGLVRYRGQPVGRY